MPAGIDPAGRLKKTCHDQIYATKKHTCSREVKTCWSITCWLAHAVTNCCQLHTAGGHHQAAAHYDPRIGTSDHGLVEVLKPKFHLEVEGWMSQTMPASTRHCWFRCARCIFACGHLPYRRFGVGMLSDTSLRLSTGGAVSFF